MQRVAVVVTVLSAVWCGGAVTAVEGEAVVVEGLVVGEVGVALVVREVPVDVDVLEDALLAVDCVHQLEGKLKALMSNLLVLPRFRRSRK